MKRIACLGDSCVDHYAHNQQKFPGGNPVNFAVYYKRLRGPASFVGAVGSDEDGRFLLQALQSKQVDCSHVQILPGPTPKTLVEMDNGNRVFASYDPGIMEHFSLRQEDFDFIAQHDLAVTAPWGNCEKSLAQLRKLGIPVAYDCADIPTEPYVQAALPFVDIAFFSDDSADEESVRARMQEIYALGPTTVIAMRGANGSLAFDGQTVYKQAAIDVDVVDTLGAGDSYIAGFLFAFLHKFPIPNCMRLGSENSAITIGYLGAW